MGVMLVSTCQAIGEVSPNPMNCHQIVGRSRALPGQMAIMFPVSGGYYTLVDRFVDVSSVFSDLRLLSPNQITLYAQPAWAFAMGWNYCLQWACTFPLELVAASFTIRFWDPHHTINVAVWISLFGILHFPLTVHGTCVFNS